MSKQKRIMLSVAVGLAALLLLSGGFCAVFWGYGKTVDGVRQNSRVKAKMREEITTKTANVTFTVKNSSIRSYVYDSRELILERKTENGYEKVEKQLGALNENHLRYYWENAKRFSDTEESIDIPYYFLQAELMPPGDYRFLLPMYPSAEKCTQKDCFYAVGYFTVIEEA